MKKPAILFSDFEKIDIRVGEVKSAGPVEGSKRLICLQVYLGEDYGTVDILTGLLEQYQPTDFIGKKFVFITNLEPRKMLTKTSNGMLLIADENEKYQLIPVSDSIPAGTIIR